MTCVCTFRAGGRNSLSPMKTLQNLLQQDIYYNILTYFLNILPDNISVILPLVNKCRLIFQILVLGELLSGNSEKQKNYIVLFGLQILWKARV